MDEEKTKTENMKGGLWLSVMGRVVLDDHSNEVFAEPHDKKIMTAQELTHGIGLKEFGRRLNKYMILENLE